jgi:glycosyltransferase involved in cell wall biosynthesis
MKICVSIASYRDPDLINTINSAYDMATNKDDISFCVVSQAEEEEHPDLSHIPHLYYYKYSWEDSRGVGWARNIAINKSKGDYILQVDSHSRFKPGWDEVIEKLYHDARGYWGDRIMLTIFPDPIERVDDEDVLVDLNVQLKTWPKWDDESQTFDLGQNWEEVEDSLHGDEVFYIAAGCTFAESKIYKSVSPDPEIYFEDQMSVAIRAYTRGMRLINMPESFVYTFYEREVNNRKLHWEDHTDWYLLEAPSVERLRKLYRGELGGYWGIQSKALYQQFLRANDIIISDEEFDKESDEEPVEESGEE